ncbi:MAG: mechanosensitive ion channel domain-containing protein, partial [Dokdonella sp.]
QQLSQVATAIQGLSARIISLREASARQQVVDAKSAADEIADQPLELRQYAADTTEIRATVLKVSQQLEVERAKRERLRAELERVASSRSNAEQILAIGRIDDEYGRVLRTIEKDLPTTSALQRRIAKRADVVTNARVQRLQAQQQMRQLEDSSAAAKALLGDADVAVSAETTAVANKLVESRRDALLDAQESLGQQIEQLGEANATDTELQQNTSQLRDFLTSKLLWLPSAAVVSGSWLTGQIGNNVGWLFSAKNLKQIPVVMAEQARKHWAVLTLLLVAITLLLVMRRRLIASLERLAKPVGHRGDGFRFTLMAELASLLIALPPPLLVGTLGVILATGDSAAAYVRAIGAGLASAAAVLFLLGIFQTMCRRFGVFTAHFGWDEKGTRRLGRALHLLALAVAPGAFLKGMADSVGTTDLVEGIGRLGFVIVSLALALFMYRVFRPHDGALTVGLDRDRFIWRTRHIWFWALVVVPIVLALLAAIGYYATASQLQSRLFNTGWIFLTTIIGYRTAMRGVLVSGRRTAYEQAEARHAKAREEAIEQADSAGKNTSEGLPELSEEPDIDVVQVSRQTRSLLLATSTVVLLLLLWGIWKSMLPVLNVLDQVVLWSYVVASPAGDTMASVSLFDVLRAVLIVVLTVVAARNLPGFLEITLLQRLRIDSGTRYAISTIGRYLIFIVGLLIAFNGIGADWSKLQWIVAALGVGLGFGLQEIVANFVSGIIILFERPVRVGDLVSIGTNTGTVTRIQIRAITITDFDNFEVLVPNKAFITGPVQNWSLTSPITRLLIKVGVAYGSNIEQVQKLMLDVAVNNAKVLKTPSPSALFVNFGDSSLDFELRAFVGRIDHRLGTTHELLMAIDAAFKNSNIEVPFPQRDLHVRSSVVGLNSEDPGSDSEN